MSKVLDTKSDVAVVVVPGDSLVTSNVTQFKDDVEALLQERTKVVLDFHQIQFIDSAGCGALLTLLKRLRALGGQLVLCTITRSVRALFDLIRMPSVVNIYSTSDEAIESLAA